jgi:hypothetical protein
MHGSIGTIVQFCPKVLPGLNIDENDFPENRLEIFGLK